MGSCLPCCKKEDHSINPGDEERRVLITSTSVDEEYGTEYDTAWGEYSSSQGEYLTSQEEYHTPHQEPREEDSTEHQLSLKFSNQKTAIKKMERGAAVVHGSIIYVIARNSCTLYCYQLGEDKWSEHSQCPHVNPGLVIINDLLTTVGGKTKDGLTNRLVSWNGEKWVEEVPPMQSPREEPAVVCHGIHVIVLGGDREESGVEVFNTSSLVWSTATSLPTGLPRVTATLCRGDVVAMANDGSTYTVLADSLVTSSPTSPAQWVHLPYQRFVGPTLTTFRGHSVVVHHDDISYQGQEGEWVGLGNMSVPMAYSIVCVVSGQMVVMGGDVSYTSAVFIIN